MGSLPDSKYIIQTDGYYFVESHDVDPSKGYITVSAKGIVNGLSNQPNDGADFGPDSYNPNYSGSGIPYTQTSGIQEAHNYRASVAKIYPSGTSYSYIPTVKLLSGTFICDADVIVYPNNNGVLGTTTTMKFEGEGHNSISQIIFQGSSVYGFDFSGAVVGTNIHMVNLNIRGSTTNLTSLINAQIPTTSSGNYLNLRSVQLAGSSGSLTNGLMIAGIAYVFLEDFDDEIGNGTTNFINVTGGFTGDGWFKVIGLRGANDVINFDASGLYSVYVDLKDSMRFNITSNGSIQYLEITGTTRSTLTNAGAIHVLTVRASMLVGSPFITNSGTIDRVEIAGLLAPQVSSGDFVTNTGTIGQIIYAKAFSFIPNGSYALGYQQLSTTTPTVPTSGTAQQNTNPYAVNVYLYGGTVTVIDYTPAGGSATQVGTTGPATVRLNPGDSITLTYSAAPTWNWVAV